MGKQSILEERQRDLDWLHARMVVLALAQLGSPMVPRPLVLLKVSIPSFPPVVWSYCSQHRLVLEDLSAPRRVIDGNQVYLPRLSPGIDHEFLYFE